MGRQQAIDDVRKAQEHLEGFGEPDLAAGLDEWLAEQEPETVTLHCFHFGKPYRFKSITRIEKPWPHTVVYGRSDDFCAGEAPLRIAESPAEVTAAARAVWPDFDCEGAEPRLADEPTVTLTKVIGGDRCRFSRIETIRQDVQVPSGRPFCAISGDYEVNGEAWLSGHTCVRQTAAAVTIVAREAWGPDWSCPGAEPPVVVLHGVRDGLPVTKALSEISRMPDANGVGLSGTLPAGGGVTIWWQIDEDAETIIAACAEAGVPCPPEEKPEPDCGPDEFVLHYQGSDGEPIICDIHDTRIEYSHTCDSMAVSRRSDSGNSCRAIVRESLEEIKREIVAMKNRGRGVPCCEKPEILVGVDPAAEDADRSVCYRWIGGATFSIADPRIAKLQKRVDGLELAATTAREAWVGEEARADNAEKRVKELDGLLVSSAKAFDAAIADFNDERQRSAELEAEATLRAETLQQTVTGLHQAWRERDRLKGVEKDLVGAHLALERMLDKSEERVEELEGSDRGLRYRLNAVRNECDKYHTERDKLRREANELKQQVADLERKHGLAIAELNDALRRHDAYAVDAVGKQESFQRMIDRDKKLVDTWIEAAAAARKERIALQALLDAREDWRETETCGYCHGSGMTGEKCAYCNGTGVVVRREGATSG